MDKRYRTALVLPNSAAVSALEAQNPNNQAAFAGSGITPFALVSMGLQNLSGASAPSANSYSSQIEFKFDQSVQNVQLGFVDPISSSALGDAFWLNLTIIENEPWWTTTISPRRQRRIVF